MHGASKGAGPARLMDLLIPIDEPRPEVPAEAAAAARMLWEPFVEVARVHPARPAVIGAQYAVSYDRLLTSALRLAESLGNAGVDQSAPVAVFIRKSWEQIAAAIGVQLAGAAYLPVPIDSPPARVAELVRETGVRVAVAGAGEPQGPLPDGIAIVTFPESGDAPALEEVVRRRDPRDLAYVIATSGTTGKPKAVMVEHGAAWNTIHAINAMFGVGGHDRVLALSALHFDLSVYDIFGVLAAGGSIVVPDAARTRDPEHWIDLCRTSAVTIWNSVPALAQMLVEGGMPRDQALGQCSSLRLMMLSGDWIPVSLAQRVRQQRPDVELVSLGGATEASIWSIVYPIREIDPSWTSVPYGNALPGQTVAVLDESLESVPPWAEGEIHIGGAGLARGYWRDEERTRERFVERRRTGERLYRTGDLGRVWPDGTVEILGRLDSQVKISGHRVELGEIEGHIHSLPGVRAALVSHRPVGPLRRKELVAYVVLAEKPSQPLALISDPIERLRFKLDEPGLRRFADAVPSIPLDPPDGAALASAFRARRTHRAFSATEVTWESLNALLVHLVQLKLDDFPLPKYLYPSAGSLYPVQAYLHVRRGRVAGIESGSYYCDPRGHAIHPLAIGADLPPSCFGKVNLRPAEQSAFSIFLVGELAAIAPMYPEQARDFCMLEAGYMGQALMAAAAGAGLGLCPIGGVEGDDWRMLLQLGDTHVFLQAFVGGVPAEDSRVARRAPSATDLRRTADGGTSRRPAGEAAALREIREQLENRLPSHMIPTSWVVLDALPLTGNGKVDRNNLPEPRTAVDADAPEVAMTPTEAKLFALWKELLGDRVLGIDQAFFHVGGDSLLLVRLQDALRRELGVDVSLTGLFQYSSIRSLAGWLDRTSNDASPSNGAANE